MQKLPGADRACKNCPERTGRAKIARSGQGVKKIARSGQGVQKLPGADRACKNCPKRTGRAKIARSGQGVHLKKLSFKAHTDQSPTGSCWLQVLVKWCCLTEIQWPCRSVLYFV